MTPINSTSVNTANADFETHAATGAKAVNVPPPPKNDVQQHHDTVPPPQAQTPTSAARETTQPTSTGYAASTPPAESQESKDAAQQLSDLQLMSSLPNKFNSDAEHGVFSLAWIRAVANDRLRLPSEREAAQRLLANPQWARADADHSGKLTLGEAAAHADKLKSGVSATPSSGGTSSANGPSDADVTGASGTTGSSSSAPPKKTVQDVMDSVPKPSPSTKEGIEGALENLGNSADYLQKQMEAIANDPNLDPAMKTAKLSNLQAQQQAAMNMLNQLAQMMQNTIKLWSDIAMNSVRNIK